MPQALTLHHWTTLLLNTQCNVLLSAGAISKADTRDVDPSVHKRLALTELGNVITGVGFFKNYYSVCSSLIDATLISSFIIAHGP